MAAWINWRVLAAYPGESPIVFELVRPGDFVVRIQVPRTPRCEDRR